MCTWIISQQIKLNRYSLHAWNNQYKTRKQNYTNIENITFKLLLIPVEIYIWVGCIFCLTSSGISSWESAEESIGEKWCNLKTGIGPWMMNFNSNINDETLYVHKAQYVKILNLDSLYQNSSMLLPFTCIL